jgi:hypothetical protein
VIATIPVSDLAECTTLDIPALSPQEQLLSLFTVAFIDSDHSFPAISKDIEIIERHLQPVGRICFDDTFSSYEGVNGEIPTRIIENARYQSKADRRSRANLLLHSDDGQNGHKSS